MEKRTIITADMQYELRSALSDKKNELEELRKSFEGRGKKDIAQAYEKRIQTVDQMLEIIGRATWII